MTETDVRRYANLATAYILSLEERLDDMPTDLDKIRLRQVFVGIRATLVQLLHPTRSWKAASTGNLQDAFDKADRALRATLMWEWFEIPNDGNIEAAARKVITFISWAIKRGDEVAHPSADKNLEVHEADRMVLRCYPQHSFADGIFQTMFDHFRTLHSGRMLIDIRDEWTAPGGRPPAVGSTMNPEAADSDGAGRGRGRARARGRGRGRGRGSGRGQ